MSLDDIRDTARAQVHAQFALPAVARSLDGLSVIPNLTVRMHRDVKKAFGDLDREGFAMVVESHNELIFDTAEWSPKRKYVIDFGRGRVFVIDNLSAPNGDRYVKAYVSEHKP